MTTIALLTDTPQEGERHTTAYGLSAPIRLWETNGHTVWVCAQGYDDPRATVRALRDLGATHLWLCEPVGALSILLEPGDWLVADDFIDGTRGQHTTYFSEKAGGYVQQVPPFDPESRAALLEGLRTEDRGLREKKEHYEAASIGRIFSRGVYVCVSNTRLETPAEAQFWTRAGGHVVGRFLSPCLPLARELEMKVAALTRVTRMGGEAGDTMSFEVFEAVISTAIAALESRGTTP